jgi:hypothetical protein
MDTIFIYGDNITMQLKMTAALFTADFKRQGNATQQ